MHVLTYQTESDKKRLNRQFLNRKKEFRFELIIFGGIWLIAPFLINRPNQQPLIESMSYGMALLYFGLAFLITLAWSYFKNLHNAVTACQTDMKRMIITEVTGIVAKPLFRKEHFRLKLADKYLRKLYLPKKDIDNFNTGDRLRIEISEFGKQVIRITPATERIVSIISQKKEELPSANRRPYSQILFNGEPARASVLQVIKSLFIPTKDRIVSMLIIDINILVFVLMLLSGVSIHAPLGIDIVNWGGNYGPLTIGEGQYWRMFTCNFLHIGIVHLLMNLIGFVLVAYFLESVLGWKLFLFTYIFTGLLSSVASLWWHSDVVSAGASGAIFGMYGMLLILLLTANKRTRTTFSGLTKTTLLFVGYNLLMGIVGSTDNAAHIGGLLSGFLLGGILLMTGFLKKLVASKSAMQNSPVM